MWAFGWGMDDGFMADGSVAVWETDGRWANAPLQNCVKYENELYLNGGDSGKGYNKIYNKMSIQWYVIVNQMQ